MTCGVERSKKIIKTVCIFILISLLTYISSSRITGQFFGWDPLENTIASLSLINMGSISDKDGKLTNQREPIPIIIHAAYIKFFTDIPHYKPIEQIIVKKDYRSAISKVNLVYVWFTLIGILILSIQLTRKFKIALAAILLSWLFFLGNVQHLYSPHTEIVASMFLVFSTISMVRLYRQVNITNAIVVGLLLGLLSLTKMPAAYVSIVSILILLVVILIKTNISFNYFIQISLSLILTFILVITPWILRNQYYSKSADSDIQSAITQRGGNILNARADLSNNIISDIPGYIYVYSPMILKKYLFEKYLGFERKDLWPEGKYDVQKYDRPDSRFKNEAIQAGYLKPATPGANESIKAKLTIQDLLNPDRKFEHDQIRHEQGMKKISNEPLKHLVSTAVVAWRGMWSFSGKSHPPESYSLYHVGNSILSVFFNFICFFSLLLMPLIAVIRKRFDLLIFSIFSVGYFWIYAIFSHFIPRYSAPLIPISVIAMLIMAQETLFKVNTKNKIN